MIGEVLKSSIPEHCIAVCVAPGDIAVLASPSGQCVLIGHDVEAILADPSQSRRIVVRGDRATATHASNLNATAQVALFEALLGMDQDVPNRVFAVMVNPESPSALARQMFEDVPELERFAKVLAKSEPAPIKQAVDAPAWARELGVLGAPRAAREDLLDAIAVFSRSTGKLELEAQAAGLVQTLRDRDASIGQGKKRKL